MNRPYKLSYIRQDPLITICWVIALVAILVGLYVVSPFLSTPGAVGGTVGGAAALWKTVASTGALMAFGGISVASGAAIIYGIKTNNTKWITRGLLTNLILRIYGLVISLLVFGVQSSIFSTVALLLIVLILYLVYKGKR